MGKSRGNYLGKVVDLAREKLCPDCPPCCPLVSELSVERDGYISHLELFLLLLVWTAILKLAHHLWHRRRAQDIGKRITMQDHGGIRAVPTHDAVTEFGPPRPHDYIGTAHGYGPTSGFGRPPAV